MFIIKNKKLLNRKTLTSSTKATRTLNLKLKNVEYPLPLKGNQIWMPISPQNVLFNVFLSVTDNVKTKVF